VDAADAALKPCLSVGVDYSKDRIIALQFPAAATGVAGTIGVGLLIDAA
jgi:hypothetical protein